MPEVARVRAESESGAVANSALVGVLGGMGPAATNCFSEQLVERTAASCDQEHLCTLVLNDASIPDRTEYLLGLSDATPLPKLLAGARLLREAGCALIAMPCNTAHAFFDDIAASVDIPVLNMIDDTVRACQRAGMARVGVLATEGTVRIDIYGEALRAAGVACVYPTPEVQRKTNAIINDYVKAGVPVPGGALAEVCDAMAALGCDGVILGCTELSVAFDGDASALRLPVVDSLRTLADSTIAAVSSPRTCC